MSVRTHIVIVGAAGEADNPDVYGFETFDQAQEFSKETKRLFAEARETLGSKAWPYGEPFVVLHRILDFGDPDYVAAPTKAVANWLYDPDVHDED